MNFTEKHLTLLGLQKGDMIKLVDGREIEFLRVKKKNFEAIINEKPYNVPVEMFDTVVKRNVVKNENEKQKKAKQFKKGDLIYVEQKGKAILFIFDYVKGDTIHVINPVNKAKGRVLGYEAHLVNEL